VLAADFGAELLPELIGNLEEDLDDGGIELRSRAVENFLARGIKATSFAVGTVAGDGVEGVGHGKDARADGNFAAGEAIGVAVAVEVLLMAEDDFSRAGEKGNLRSML